VVCADTANGKAVWKLDMMKELKVVPFHLAAGCPLVVGDLVFVVTGNGRDEMGNLASPKAPSFLALHKKTGKVAWQSNLPGEKIIEGQWSNPAYAEIDGKPQVIFPGGDAWLYSFEPTTGKLIWKFNCTPNEEGAKDRDGVGNYLVATPVVHDKKVYVGLGMMPERPDGPRYSYFLCIDASKTGDVSPPKGNLKADAPENKDSALVWALGGRLKERPKKGRQAIFTRTMSTCAIHDGLVYIPEEEGWMNCLDAKTGERYWIHDFRTILWGSPMWVDNKVYQGTENGEITIFAHGKNKNVIANVSMDELVHSTPVIVNGALYVTTPSKLYAIGAR
jgi:outer membrane protein assembly factor BamB